MTVMQFIVASLRHYRRIHAAIAGGVAVATAVLTGALLVGDSVNGSLEDLTLQRLGSVDSALVAGHFFREALADELAKDANFQRFFTAAEPAILLTGSLQSGSGNTTRRSTAVSLIGSRESFGNLRYEAAPRLWATAATAPLSVSQLKDDEIALTQSLASELQVERGDDLFVRIPVAGAIPADSPLGEKSDTSTGRRFKVAHVLPSVGQARFSLLPSQHEPRNAFLSLETLQGMLDKPGAANAILLATSEQRTTSEAAAQAAVHKALRPMLEDFGVRITPVTSPASYVELSSDQLVLPAEVVRAAQESLGDLNPQKVSTYLANTLTAGTGAELRKIPYSTITGLDSPTFVLADDEIALNRWAADELRVNIGDAITVTFYEPESTHGRLRERSPPPTFKLKAILPLETADGTPTPAADPRLTPELPGVTDQNSIRDWELPFELVETIGQQDEDYWDKFRTTPKAFVSLATAQRLWPSRWGNVSLIRFVGEHSDAAVSDIREKLAAEIEPSALGMRLLPVKRIGLDAAGGTTPFGGLFLGFSFFIIAAALMLIAILFQLGVQQRARELGTLAAMGVPLRRIVGLLSREGLCVAVVGATFGVAGGVLYAALMIAGLRTWWLNAIATPFLELHIGWRSILISWFAGVALSWATIRWSIRQLVRAPTAQLLSGSFANRFANRSRRYSNIAAVARIALPVLIAGLLAFSFWLDGEAQAGAFFGTGALVLVWLLVEVFRRLSVPRGMSANRGALSLSRLARLNAARNPGRSVLTIGLVAAASFLILSISAFRLETTDAGVGGFDYLATSDRPVHFDLNTEAGRVELGFSDEETEQLDAWRVYSLRVSDGEDASCLNLYRPSQPRVLGVPPDFVERCGFQWSAVAARTHDQRDVANPWRALDAPLGDDANGLPVVPVVLDASTAAYSLHLDGLGSRLTIRDANGEPVTLEVVGLLKNSVLQGNLLIAEQHFLRRFPEVAGHRFFLIERRISPGRTPPKVATELNLAALLETRLASEGFDVVDARRQLATFLEVQNTYLSTFQSLGALGLLLGTVGLAVVQLRNVLERRGELALMQAGGFSKSRLVALVVLENAVLLLGGLAIGGIAAAIALIPQWAPHGANVPWLTMLGLLATIAAVGIAAGWVATRSTLRASIVPALRGD